jgi:hypothetical protein
MPPPPATNCMQSTTWQMIVCRWHLLIHRVLGVATALWLLLLGLELTSEELDVDRFLRLLFLGGGAIFLLRLCARAATRAGQRLRRRNALRAVARDPLLASQGSRKDAIPFLLGRDSERIVPFPWRRRFESLIGVLVHRILSAPAPRSSLEKTMIRCLALLRSGRRHWRTGRAGIRGSAEDRRSFLGLDDEGVLQLLLLVLVLLSALFRLHLLLWGMPAAPFDRENMSRLRSRWIRFCMLEPTTRGFPPSLPKEMQAVVRKGPIEETELGNRLIAWVFRAERGALSRAVEAMCEARGTPEISIAPEK